MAPVLRQNERPISVPMLLKDSDDKCESVLQVGRSRPFAISDNSLRF